MYLLSMSFRQKKTGTLKPANSAIQVFVVNATLACSVPGHRMRTTTQDLIAHVHVPAIPHSEQSSAAVRVHGAAVGPDSGSGWQQTHSRQEHKAFLRASDAGLGD
jgi:hypothetical protein